MDWGRAPASEAEDAFERRWRSGDLSAALAQAEAWLAGAADAGERAAAGYARGKCLLMLTRWGAACEALGEAATGAWGADRGRLFIAARCDQINGMRNAGRLLEAVSLLDDLEALLLAECADPADRAWGRAWIELERAQCHGQLGDQVVQAVCCARAEAFAASTEDRALEVWAEVVGSRPLVRSERSDRYSASLERVDRALHFARARGDRVLEARALLHKSIAVQRSGDPEAALAILDALDDIQPLLSETTRLREQALLQRVACLVSAGRPLDAAEYVAREGAHLEEGAFAWRILYQRRSVDALKALGLDGLALERLLGVVGDPAVQAELNRRGWVPVERWYGKLRDALMAQQGRVPRSAQERREIDEALEHLIAAGAHPPPPSEAGTLADLTGVYEALEARAQEWMERLLPGLTAGLTRESQADLVRAHVTYTLCFDELGRVAHLLALVVERELLAKVLAPLQASDLDLAAVQCKEDRDKLRKVAEDRASLGLVLEIVVAAARQRGCAGLSEAAQKCCPVKHATAAFIAAHLPEGHLSDPDLAALTHLAEPNEGVDLREARNAFAHGRRDRPFSRRDVDRLILRLFVLQPRPLAVLARLGEARSRTPGPARISDA